MAVAIIAERLKVGDESARILDRLEERLDLPAESSGEGRRRYTISTDDRVEDVQSWLERELDEVASSWRLHVRLMPA